MQGRILVVDDEEAVRNVLRRFLAQKGYEVAMAASGEEALKSLGRERPHLVLLDMRMPGMDGMAVLKELRASNPRIAVMMVTANEDIDLAKEALELGASDYITKPVDLSYLETTVMAKMASLDRQGLDTA